MKTGANWGKTRENGGGARGGGFNFQSDFADKEDAML